MSYLEHHGILGQRWGVRRFQNPDGSLTKAGQKRYGTEGSRTAKQTQNRLNDVQKAVAYNQRDLNNANKTISTFSNKKGSNDFQKGKIAEAKEIQKNIKTGEKEIQNIIKKSGDYDITSKDIRQNTTPGLTRTYQTLAIVGTIPLGIIPGPNIPLGMTVGYKVATTKANTVDSKKYKVKQKEITEITESDADNSRGANWYLEPNGDSVKSKNRSIDVKRAEPYIKKMSNDQIKREIESNKKFAEHWKSLEKEDIYAKDYTDIFKDNVRLYEKEMNRRAGADFDGNLNYNGYEIPKKAPKQPVDRTTIIEEAVKAANGGKPYNSVYEFSEAYQKIGKEINNHWNNKPKNRK